MGELALALRKFQSQCPAIPKDKTAIVPTRSGGNYKYQYADLGNIVDAIAPHLDANGLVAIQGCDIKDGKPFIFLTLYHASGEFSRSELPLPLGDDCQETGAAITYYRRYLLVLSLGIVTESDEDAQTQKPKVNHVTHAPQTAPASASRASVPSHAADTHTTAVAQCAICGTHLVLSKSGAGYYCPNFKELGNGEHTRFSKGDLESYLQKQAIFFESAPF
jgi:hypothetical protein